LGLLDSIPLCPPIKPIARYILWRKGLRRDSDPMLASFFVSDLIGSLSVFTDRPVSRGAPRAGSMALICPREVVIIPKPN
jgi:hypothetical protein